jgi:hypothetical protein
MFTISKTRRLYQLKKSKVVYIVATNNWGMPIYHLGIKKRVKKETLTNGITLCHKEYLIKYGLLSYATLQEAQQVIALYSPMATAYIIEGIIPKNSLTLHSNYFNQGVAYKTLISNQIIPIKVVAN